MEARKLGFDFVETLLLVLCALSFFRAGLELRPFYHDGGAAFFSVLNDAWFFYDRSSLRVTSLVLQIPSVLALRYSLLPLPVLREILPRLYSLILALYPLLSLYACLKLCRSRRSPTARAFVLLAFATITQTVQANTGGLVPEVLALFWPLFLIVLFPSDKPRLDAFWIVALSLALAFEHESAVLFTPVLGVASLFRPNSRSEARSPIIDRVYFFLFGALGAWLSFRILTPKAIDHEWFVNDLHRPWGAYTILCAVNLSAFLAASLSLAFLPRRKTVAAIILMLSATATICYGRTALESVNLGEIAYDRTTAVAKTALAALVLLLIERRRKPFKQGLAGSPLFPVVRALVALLLLYSIVIDLHLTDKWDGNVAEIRRGIAAGPACQEITLPFPSDFNPVFIPELSLVLSQGPTDGPQRIAIPEHYLWGHSNAFTAFKPDVCCDIAQNRIPLYDRFVDISSSAFFDPTRLRAAIQSQQGEFCKTARK